MKNQLKTIFLLGILSALLIAFGSALGPGFFYGFIFLAILLNFGAYFFSDRLILKMSGAQEVTHEEAPELHRMVEELAQRAQIPKPRVCLIPDAQPNAFATGRNPQHGVVAVTEGIVNLLTERELRGVVAHEIAHIKNRDILVSTIAAVIGAAIGYLANTLSFAAFFGGNQEDNEEGGSAASSLLFIFIAPLVSMLVQFAISRAREYLADETGAHLANDPEALARALEKLERGAEQIPAETAQPATASLYIINPLLGGGQLANLFSTHPPTAERTRRLRALVGAASRFAA
ncbi:MAG: zinc metalloprotease HtpX [Candidatus Binatia bacterium]